MQCRALWYLETLILYCSNTRLRRRIQLENASAEAIQTFLADLEAGRQSLLSFGSQLCYDGARLFVITADTYYILATSDFNQVQGWLTYLLQKYPNPTLKYLLSLPYDTQRFILGYFDFDSIIGICNQTPDLQRIAHDPYFWQDKAKRDFGVVAEKFQKGEPKLPYLRYAELLTNKGGCARLSTYFGRLKICAERAAKMEKESLLSYFIGCARRSKRKIYGYVAQGAAQGGHLRILRLALSNTRLNSDRVHNLRKAALNGGHLEALICIDSYVTALDADRWDDWYDVKIAARLGRKDLLDYCLKGFESTEEPWNAVLIGAAEGGHLDLVKKAIENGADKLKRALKWAASEHKVEVVKWFLTKTNQSAHYSAMFKAAEYGHMDLVLLLESECNLTNFNNVMIAAASSDKRLPILKYASQRGANTFQDALELAAEGEAVENLKFLLGLEGIIYDLQKALERAVSDGCVEATKLLIAKGAKPYKGMLGNFIYTGLEAMEYIYSLGAENVETMNKLLKEAVFVGKLEFVRFAIDHGATDIEAALSNSVHRFSSLHYNRRILDYLATL